MGTNFSASGGGAAAGGTGWGTKEMFHFHLGAGHLKAAPLIKAAEAHTVYCSYKNSRYALLPPNHSLVFLSRGAKEHSQTRAQGKSVTFF